MIRFFDILFSGMAILCLSPLLIPVVLILKLTGEHDVFYCQTRIGRKGKPFGLMKFATMLRNSPNLGTGDITTRNDPRVLPFGRFLRKTKLNELPQLFNIFLGSMSVIGPRPLTPKNFEMYSDDVKEAIGRMRPGLSGIGSVVFRDEESILAESGMDYTECYRTRVSPYKGELEQWYAEHRSLYCYFSLIFLTVWVVLFPKSELVYRWFRDLPPKPDWMKKTNSVEVDRT